ncbi:muscle M-line assembly protein unc-89-like [Panonychus citri]|uniref:muscle M-line assembly protein unc-89-like n=1 Tax=Panonychus citri TaxID=50023 RepID=UPI0023071E7B|nr:muscle M-line assembly protein unc-89-like [Panonychus citri]
MLPQFSINRLKNQSSVIRKCLLIVIKFTPIFLLIQFSFLNCYVKSDPTDIRMTNPGERLHIPCTMINPGGSIQWIKNGQPILLDFSSSQRRHWNITKDGQAALTINRVTKADEGIWECWELDNNGNVKQKSHVMKITVANVPEGPFLQVDGQRIEENGRVTVRDKRLLTITCIVKGASPATRSISWSINGINVTDFSQLLMEYSADDNSYESFSVLTINVTKEDHKKTLVCQAEHSAWSKPMSVRTNLNIQYEPAFSLIRDPVFGYPIVEGMSILLRCVIDANPPSQPQWIRDHSLTPGSSKLTKENLFTSLDGSLNIASVSFADTGWYRCTTDHSFGHFDSFSYYLNVRSRSFLKEWSSVMCASKGSPPDGPVYPESGNNDLSNDPANSSNNNNHNRGSPGNPRQPYPSPRWSQRYPQRPLPTPDWTFRKPSGSFDNNDLSLMSSAPSQNTQSGSAFSSKDQQNGRSRFKSGKSLNHGLAQYPNQLVIFMLIGCNIALIVFTQLQGGGIVIGIV